MATIRAVPVCVVCGGPLREVEAFRSLPRVTSDSRPFRPGGRIASCQECGTIQKIGDERWYAEIDEIYGSYDIYHQSGSVDQPVFNPRVGTSRPRGAILVDFVATASALPEHGVALDVGCGNGAFLSALAALRPEWKLFGSDLGEHNRSRLEAIPGFEALYTCKVGAIPGTYNLISLVHALEHFPDPVGTLASLKERIAPNGCLFIQVPNATATPFDLVVADHLSHFTPRTLSAAVLRGGLAIDRVSSNVVVKEISLLVGQPPRTPCASARAMDASPLLAERIEWLRQTVALAESSAMGANFGLFGTSIAAVWLLAGLKDRVKFFVDEDRARIGRTLFGRPIFAPEDVPSGATVMLAFIPTAATAIRSRLARLPITLVPPPNLPG